jgi:hypothetical protein
MKFMKAKITLILLMLLLSLQQFALAQRCQNPMPANVFRQNLNQLALKPNDQAKLQFSKTMLQGSCLLSSQVKDLAMVFSGDYYRFEFAKRAYKHTFDPGNFFDVYDAFGSLSAAMRLYDHVSKRESDPTPGPGPGPGPGPAPVVNPPRPWYPDLAYPVAAGYRGVVGCQLPLADNDFELLALPVVAQKTDMNRRTEALKLMGGYCLSLGQVMKLSTLMELESNRLAFMKEVYTKLYDMENYSYATEVFSHMPYKNDWLAYCNSMLAPPAPEPVQPPVVVCEVTVEDYNDIKRSIGSVAVNSTRLTLAKQIISTKKCFTVRQIGGIMDIFSVESSRLDLALYSYDFCIDKSNYYKLTENLSTTSSKNALLDFLKNK